jgi:hypothetical protein
MGSIPIVASPPSIDIAPDRARFLIFPRVPGSDPEIRDLLLAMFPRCSGGGALGGSMASVEQRYGHYRVK